MLVHQLDSDFLRPDNDSLDLPLDQVPVIV
jgi:hypothetical protein